jgi:hypothetical protein
LFIFLSPGTFLPKYQYSLHFLFTYVLFFLILLDQSSPVTLFFLSSVYLHHSLLLHWQANIIFLHNILMTFYYTLNFPLVVSLCYLLVNPQFLLYGRQISKMECLFRTGVFADSLWVKFAIWRLFTKRMVVGLYDL